MSQHSSEKRSRAPSKAHSGYMRAKQPGLSGSVGGSTVNAMDRGRVKTHQATNELRAFGADGRTLGAKERRALESFLTTSPISKILAAADKALANDNVSDTVVDSAARRMKERENVKAQLEERLEKNISDSTGMAEAAEAGDASAVPSSMNASTPSLIPSESRSGIAPSPQSFGMAPGLQVSDGEEDDDEAEAYATKGKNVSSVLPRTAHQTTAPKRSMNLSLSVNDVNDKKPPRTLSVSDAPGRGLSQSQSTFLSPLASPHGSPSPSPRLEQSGGNDNTKRLATLRNRQKSARPITPNPNALGGSIAGSERALSIPAASEAGKSTGGMSFSARLRARYAGTYDGGSTEKSTDDGDDDREHHVSLPLTPSSMLVFLPVFALILVLLITSTRSASDSTDKNAASTILFDKSAALSSAVSDYFDQAPRVAQYTLGSLRARRNHMGMDTQPKRDSLLDFMLDHGFRDSKDSWRRLVGGLFLGREDGMFVGYTLDSAAVHNDPTVKELTVIPIVNGTAKQFDTANAQTIPFDLTQRPWWLASSRLNSDAVSDPYSFASSGAIGVTFSYTVPQLSASLVHILGVDFVFDEMDTLLRGQLDGEDRFGSFVVHTRTGFLMAASEPGNRLLENGDPLPVSESDNPNIRAIIRFLLSTRSALAAVPSPFEGEPTLLDGTPLIFLSRTLSFPGMQAMIVVYAQKAKIQTTYEADTISLDIVLAIVLMLVMAFGLNRVLSSVLVPLTQMQISMDRAVITGGKIPRKRLIGQIPAVFCRETWNLYRSAWDVIEEVLHRAVYIPRDVMDNSFHEVPASEFKSVTVLAITVTPLLVSTGSDPAKVSCATSVIVTELLSLCHFFQGTVDHVAARGSTAVVYWGGFGRSTFANYRAIYCALAMQRRVEEVNRVLAARGLPEYQMLAGIDRKKAEFGEASPDSFRVSPSGDLVRSAIWMSRLPYTNTSKEPNETVRISPQVVKYLTVVRPENLVMAARKTIGVRAHDVQAHIQPVHRKLFQTSWSIIKENALETKYGEVLYAEMFTAMPILREVFPKNDAQRIKLIVHMLDHISSSMDDMDRLTSNLRQLGQRHVGYGVKDEYFPVVKSSFINAMSIVLKDAENFRPKFGTAWVQVLNTAHQLMVVGMREAERDDDTTMGSLAPKADLVAFRESWNLLQSNGLDTEYGRRVYTIMFTQMPSLKKFFRQGLDANAVLATRMMGRLAEATTDSVSMSRILLQLGRRHAEYNIQDQYFPVVKDSFTVAMKEVLQAKLPEAYKPEYLRAWVSILNVAETLMLQGMRTERKQRRKARHGVKDEDLIPRDSRLLFQDSWSLLTKDDQLVSDYGVQVYDIMFSAMPDLEKLFPTSVAVRTPLIARMMTYISSSMNDMDKLRDHLLDLGRRHANYNVTDEMFPVVKNAFAKGLERVLTKAGQWRPEFMQAWTQVLDLCHTIMKEGMDDVLGASGSTGAADGDAGTLDNDVRSNFTKSWNQIRELKLTDKFGITVHKIMIAKDAKLAEKFPKDIAIYSKLVAHMISNMAGAMQDMQSFRSTIYNLGKRHKNYNVEESNFPVVKDSFQLAAREVLEENNAWEDGYARAWTVVLNVAHSIMRQGLADAEDIHEATERKSVLMARISRESRTAFRKSWFKIMNADLALDFAREAYKILFKSMPELRTIFPSDDEKRGSLLRHMMSHVAESIDDPATLASHLNELGIRHHAYGIQEEWFPPVKTAFAQGMEQVLIKAGSYRKSYTAAWYEVLNVAQSMMVQGMRAAAENEKSAILVSADERTMFREAWEQITKANLSEKFGKNVYKILFSRAPELRAVFPDDDLVRARLVTHMMSHIAASVDDLNKMSQSFRQLGQRHAAYNVQDEHFPVVQDAFALAMRETLRSAGLFKEPYFPAWVSMLETAHALMREGIADGVPVYHIYERPDASYFDWEKALAK